jgi:hypothetical protein
VAKSPVLLKNFVAVADEHGFRALKRRSATEPTSGHLSAWLARRVLLAISPGPTDEATNCRSAAADDDLSHLFVLLSEAAREHETSVAFLDEAHFRRPRRTRGANHCSASGDLNELRPQLPSTGTTRTSSTAIDSTAEVAALR